MILRATRLGGHEGRKENSMSTIKKDMYKRFAAAAQKATGRGGREAYIPMSRMVLLEASEGQDGISYVMVKDAKTGKEIQCMKKGEVYVVDDRKTRIALYAAYGSNMNIRQMEYRCPNAKIIGTGKIKGYRLTFRRGGYANIEPAEDESVPILVWDTTISDERRLDQYEGYPDFYTKELVEVEMDDGEKKMAYIYIMTNTARGEYAVPTVQYYRSVKSGYIANCIDLRPLIEARRRALIAVDDLYDKIKGALYGVAIGDSLGAPVEFMSADDIKLKYGQLRDMQEGGWLNVKPGEITDDTQMTFAVCNGICNSPDDPVPRIGHNFIKWYNSDPKDVGGTCAASISRAIRMLKESGEQLLSTEGWMKASGSTAVKDGERVDGNGALMRTVYPALFYKKQLKGVFKAELIARMTHAGKISTKACILYTNMLYSLLSNGGRSDIAKLATGNADISGIYGILPFEDYDLNPSGYVKDSFKCALAALLTTDNFEEALIRAVNLGGDADTIGAITGGLAGAMYGYSSIPDRWSKELSCETKSLLDYYTDQAYDHRRE